MDETSSANVCDDSLNEPRSSSSAVKTIVRKVKTKTKKQRK